MVLPTKDLFISDSIQTIVLNKYVCLKVPLVFNFKLKNLQLNHQLTTCIKSIFDWASNLTTMMQIRKLLKTVVKIFIWKHFVVLHENVFLKIVVIEKIKTLTNHWFANTPPDINTIRKMMRGGGGKNPVSVTDNEIGVWIFHGDKAGWSTRAY